MNEYVTNLSLMKVLFKAIHDLGVLDIENDTYNNKIIVYVDDINRCEQLLGKEAVFNEIRVQHGILIRGDK